MDGRTFFRGRLHLLMYSSAITRLIGPCFEKFSRIREKIAKHIEKGPNLATGRRTFSQQPIPRVFLLRTLFSLQKYENCRSYASKLLCVFGQQTGKIQTGSHVSGVKYRWKRLHLIDTVSGNSSSQTPSYVLARMTSFSSTIIQRHIDGILG